MSVDLKQLRVALKLARVLPALSNTRVLTLSFEPSNGLGQLGAQLALRPLLHTVLPPA